MAAKKKLLPPSTAGVTGYYSSHNLDDALATMNRIGDILNKFQDPQQPLLVSQGQTSHYLTPLHKLTDSYREAINGELAVMRAQLYSTGLFRNIDCVELPLDRNNTTVSSLIVKANAA